MKEKRKNRPKTVWCAKTLSSHRIKGYDVIITYNELLKIAEKTNTCPLCGRKIDWSYGNKNGVSQWNSPSLDRINNEHTMTIDNVWILCNECNWSKSTRTLNDYIEHCKRVLMNFGD